MNNQINYQVLELFPTPVFTTNVPPSFSTLLPLFYQQEMLNKEVDSINYGERSKNSYILDEPEYISLKNYILSLINEYSTPSIKFHPSASGVNSPTIRPSMKPGPRKYTHEHFTITPTPGLLLLFPSYLHHSVPLNKSNITRCSLSFNSIPTIGFGGEMELTELKF